MLGLRYYKRIPARLAQLTGPWPSAAETGNRPGKLDVADCSFAAPCDAVFLEEGDAAMHGPADLAAHYREQAAELRAKAAKEPAGSTFKDQLLDLAGQYDRLVTQAETGSYR